MKFVLIFVFIIIFELFLKPSHCIEVSALHPWLLKPIMLANKMYSYFPESIFQTKDYVCSLTSEKKMLLCEKVFQFQPVTDLTKPKVRFDKNLSDNNYDYTCKAKTFNCYLNKIFRLGMNQEMLLCPLTGIVNGKEERIMNYYISTNYTSGRVIVFEADNEDKVGAVVGLWDINLLDLK